LFSLLNKGQSRGVSPHTRQVCPLTHYGDLFDGKAANAVAFSAHKGFVKNWTKNFSSQKHEMLLYQSFWGS